MIQLIFFDKVPRFFRFIKMIYCTPSKKLTFRTPKLGDFFPDVSVNFPQKGHFQVNHVRFRGCNKTRLLKKTFQLPLSATVRDREIFAGVGWISVQSSIDSWLHSWNLFVFRCCSAIKNNWTPDTSPPKKKIKRDNLQRRDEGVLVWRFLKKLHININLPVRHPRRSIPNHT